MADNDKTTELNQDRYRSRFGASSYLLLLTLLLVSCASKPAEETVTVRTSQQATVPTGVSRTSTSPLPVRDPNIEKAGDLIAGATLHLHQRQGVAALHALSLAETEIKSALNTSAQKRTTHDELVSVQRELETVRETIRRGMFDEAIRRLTNLNLKLDSIN